MSLEDEEALYYAEQYCEGEDKDATYCDLLAEYDAEYECVTLCYGECNFMVTCHTLCKWTAGRPTGSLVVIHIYILVVLCLSLVL